MEALLLMSPNHSEKTYEAGDPLLRQGEKRDQLLILSSGAVAVSKNGVTICTITERGSVFGEISALLKSYQNATVWALERSVCYIIPEAEKFVSEQPEAASHLARLLARRLALMDSHYADLKSRKTENATP